MISFHRNATYTQNEKFKFHQYYTLHMKEMVIRNGTKQTFIFKDPSPLAEDFIPKRIQFRDKQISTINYYLSGLIGADPDPMGP